MNLTGKLLIILMAVALTGCPSSDKESPSSTFGQDWLAAQHPAFNLGEALEELPDRERRPIGVLDWSFGESMDPIKLILGSGKASSIRVHFINGPCIRNSNCGGYEYGSGYSIDSFNSAVANRVPKILSRFRDRVGRYCSLVDVYPSIQFYFSYVLEHNLSIEAWSVLNQEATSVCDSSRFSIVNNPNNTHPFPRNPVPNVLYELHQIPNTMLDVNSLDGVDVDDIDINEWKLSIGDSKTGLALVWAWSYNCRVNGASFVDPRQRSACPSRGEHRRLNNIAR